MVVPGALCNPTPSMHFHAPERQLAGREWLRTIATLRMALELRDEAGDVVVPLRVAHVADSPGCGAVVCGRSGLGSSRRWRGMEVDGGGSAFF
jgi:hypothetical protein